MELKEYFKIIKKYRRFFVGIVVITVVGVWAFFYFRPLRYEASLTLNISRLGTQNTNDYRYDNFYRLQADEKFSETVVEWLKSPRVLSDIYSGAGIKENLGENFGNFSAEKRSSQVIFVNFLASSEKEAQKISKSVVKVVSRETQKLNQKQKSQDWFDVLGGEPVVEKDVPNYEKIIVAAFIVGLFLAFWGVLIKHYLE